MKRLKIAGLLAVAVAALMVFAATAAANPTLTSPKGTTYTGSLHAQTEGHATLAQPNLAAIECESTAAGEVSANGTPASIKGTSLSFGNSGTCTNQWHVTVVSAGTLTINSAGAVSSTGVTVESTRMGVICRYASSGTGIGTVTDSEETGETATLHINGFVPFHGGSPFCGSEPTKWEGSYLIDTPDALYID